MKITIGAKIIVEDYTEEILDYAIKNLRYPNPKYYLNERIGLKNWNVPKEIVMYEKKGNTLLLPYGTLRDIWPLIRDYPRTLDFKPIATRKLLPRTTLRDYQNKALEGCLKAKGGVLISPCGSGKTLTGMHLISKINQRTLWIVHTSDLMKQAMNCAKSEFINLKENDIGTITNGEVNIGEIITFATIQTLAKINLEDYKDYWNCVVVDECSHCASTPTAISMYGRVMNTICARYKYGLTATPKRIDGLTPCMYSLLGQKCYEVYPSEVESIKCKAKLIVVQLPTQESLYYYDTDYKLIQYKFDERIATNEARNINICNKIIECKDKGRKYQLVLCNRVVQCEILARKLKDYGLRVGLLVGGKSKVNQSIITNYMDYDVVIGTYNIASEGLDMPALDTLHLASPKTKNNKALLVQCIGRVERGYPTKVDSEVYTYEDIEIARSRQATKQVQLAMGKKGYIF